MSTEPTAPVEPSVRERLLDATLAVAADHGLARLSVGDVAKRAGLSRQTLYKHFGSKDEIVSATVLREASRLVEGALAAIGPDDEPIVALESGIAEALRQVRHHPLLDRLVATEPEALLPLLIDGDSPVLPAVDLICRQMLEQRLADLDDVRVRAAADLLSRMLVSYSVRPPSAEPETVARFLSAAVAGALGVPLDPHPVDPPTRPTVPAAR